ncbi:MAG: hypothetical protein HWD85_00365 [Flavobacteriaceae bacterium]|nr:hypothetical protein [Flavobacteriaceae bacterium]
MKKIITLLALTFVVNLTAQTQYEKGMTNAFQLWGAKKNAEASQLFERIANAEKNNWLPYYYAATVEIVSCFGLQDEVVLTARLKKAKKFLDKANALSKDNPEITINYALLNTAYIAFDGQKYGMTLSQENAALYAEALKLAPNNPRVIFSKAEWDMGSARFFGQSIAPYCKDVKRAIELAKKETVPYKFYPRFQFDRAQQTLKNCAK